MICGTWLIHMCDMSCQLHTRDATWLIAIRDVNHAYVCHDSCIRGTWLMHIWDVTHTYVGRDSCTRGTWLIHTWDMTHAYVGRDSCIRVTWLMHTWDVIHSHSYMTCQLYTNDATWRMHIYVTTHSAIRLQFMHRRCDMTHSYECHSYAWRDSFICVTWLFKCVTLVIHMFDMTHSNVRHDSPICVP